MGIRPEIVTSSLVFLLCTQCGGNSSTGGGPTPLSNGGVGGTGGTSLAAGGNYSSGGVTATSGGAPPAMGGNVGFGGTTPLGTGGTLASGGTIGGGGTIGMGGTIDTGGTSGMGGAGGTMTSSGGASGAPGDCGTRTTMRGKTMRTLMVNGTARTYIAYLPQSANPTTPVPLVYIFHGATQTGADMWTITGYNTVADKEGIAAVYLDGQGTSSATGTGNLAPWNVTDGPELCGLGTLVSNANPIDFPFVDAVLADIKNDQCIDSSHVYATGFSMGGYFTHHIACDRKDFRAAAPHSGGTMADLSSCKTGHVPIIIFHGQSDPLINAACDDPTLTPQSGFPASATLWAKKNGCMNTYQTIPEMGTTSGDNGNCYLYDGCPADGQVEVCTFAGMPHAWAGAAQCPGCIGSGAGYASATQLEWDFFKKYAW
ncbi:MAG TPA: PHB depolymerase family esterase [Polyangiaceae bacterium]|nr:PHB depolymerase family esterase [Polyangiaceae bacterium]